MKLKLLITSIILSIVPILSYGQYSESEWKDRDTWMPLEVIYKAAGIKKGHVVADIGCHEGYLSVRLAKQVGETGQVYAEDIREDRLELLKDHLKTRNISNVKTILGDYSDPKLPKERLDSVFIIDTYHEIDDNMTVLKHVYESLKPGGRLIILEKLKARVKGKSRDAMTMAHSLAPKYVKKELKKAGFKITAQFDDLGDWEEDSEKVMWLIAAVK